MANTLSRERALAILAENCGPLDPSVIESNIYYFAGSTGTEEFTAKYGHTWEQVAAVVFGADAFRQAIIDYMGELGNQPV